MSLSYKNYSSEEILNSLRNINYFNGKMLYGFNNNINIKLNFEVDVLQVTEQADVFAREIYTYRSQFDMKRFLGACQDDWLRLLHEAYVYDYVRCVYYGVESVNMIDFPENIYAFTGHSILTQYLSRRTFNFSLDDAVPCTIYADISYSGKIADMLKDIFLVYPDLENGISKTPNVPSYVNAKYEAILKGLNGGLEYLNSRNNKLTKNLFSMSKLNDTNVKSVMSKESNPLLNSFLSKDKETFFFINPSNLTGPSKLRFNESLYLSRALGFTSEQITIEGNGLYKTARRNLDSDFLTREDVYSITQLKSELLPYTWEQILDYLLIDTYKEEHDKETLRANPKDVQSNSTKLDGGKSTP